MCHSFLFAQVHFSEDNVSQLQFDLSGPVDTPFSGGLFRVRLQLAADHPASAPKGWFLTKIFHPNMNNKSGEICVSTLKKDWKPTLGLRHVMISIRCLLIEPNPESALNEDAAKLMLDNYADYYARAKIMTKIHAKPAASAAAAAAAAGSAKDDEDEAMASPSAAAAAAAPAASTTAAKTASPSLDGAAAAAAPSAIGEEENKNTANMPASAAAAGVAQVSGVKRPLSVSSAANSGSAAGSASAAGAPPAKVSASMSAAAAAEAKAKALKKKSTKRI